VFLRNVGSEVMVCCAVAGRQFDKDGNMMQWWNNITIRAFRERAQCIVDQYSGYKLDEVDLHVNGRMTQGENIADNGGLKQSFRVSPSHRGFTVRKRTVPTERPQPVGEIHRQFLRVEGCRVVSAADHPRPLISVF
jgi:hypothetical protein